MAVVETKVKASTAAAAVSGLALWALGRYVFKGSVPDVVVSWTYVIVPSLITFAAGYLARHTNVPAPLPVIAMPPVPGPGDPGPIEMTGTPAEKTLTPPPGAGM